MMDNFELKEEIKALIREGNFDNLYQDQINVLKGPIMTNRVYFT